MRRWMNLLMVVLFPLAPFSADAKPSAHLLNRWVGGKWVGDGRFTDSDYSKKNTATVVTHCSCSPDHVFVVCDQDVNFGGTPMRDLSIHAFDPKSGQYYFYRIIYRPGESAQHEAGHQRRRQRWMYSSSQTIKDKVVDFRTTNLFHGNDRSNGGRSFPRTVERLGRRRARGKEKPASDSLGNLCEPEIPSRFMHVFRDLLAQCFDRREADLLRRRFRKISSSGVSAKSSMGWKFSR